jgi:Holliday junction resolvase RusA-like endonuclease
MQKINFTIYGNQEDKAGNPIPYLRRTQGSLWTPQAKRYTAWKEYVCSHLLDKYPKGVYANRIALKHKPISLGKNQKVEISLWVYFKDNHRADLDNILKGINDALFVNDKDIRELHCWSVNAMDKKGKILVEIVIK